MSAGVAPGDDTQHALDDSNRRDKERLFFAAEVLIAQEAQGWRTAVLDLSEGGCALLRPSDFDLHIGTVVTLYFLTRRGPGPAVGARVARLGGRDIGFEYHDVQAIPPRLPAPRAPLPPA